MPSAYALGSCLDGSRSNDEESRRREERLRRQMIEPLIGDFLREVAGCDSPAGHAMEAEHLVPRTDIGEDSSDRDDPLNVESCLRCEAR